jgi:signal transduction histidine kinase
MNPVTAICFLASGIALVLLSPQKRNRWRSACGNLLALGVGLVGALRLEGLLQNRNTEIDQLFYRASVNAVGHTPARMAAGTALDFILISVALLALEYETPRSRRPSQYLAFVLGTIALIAATGYAYGVQPFSHYRLYHSMSLPTAACFLLLAYAILMARPDKGFVAVFFSSGAGGVVARRLLPLAVLAPIVLGWMRIAGQAFEWFDVEAGFALSSAAYVVLLAIIVIATAQSLHRIDQERDRSRRQLETSEHRYRVRSAELEALNKELESFSYTVSHDLRSPLRGIDGFSRILLDEFGEPLGQRGRDYLARVSASAQRMGTLIDDLLSLSRVARVDLRREDVDLTALASAIAAALRRDQPDRNVEFRIAPGLRAHGDAGLIRVALDNLLGNSWKFTERREGAVIEFGARAENGVVAYFVRDNGAGFEQAYAHQLFGAFRRLHGDAEFEGTGIGLATVQRVIDRHGGKIWARGEIDRGATFYFTLAHGSPAAANPQAIPPPHAAAPEPVADVASTSSAR